MTTDPPPPGRSRHPGAATALGGAAAVVSLLPLFLVGAMAVQITAELGFGAVGLGLAVAVFRGTGAASSIHLGRLADRMGATRSIRLAAALAAAGSLGIATAARSLTGLVAWLVVAGTAVALAQPAANRLLIRSVGMRRLGAAFGVKQSAPPAASVLAGASVPLIALTLGWRWGYGLAAVLAVAVLLAAGRAPARSVEERRARAVREPLGRPGLIVLLSATFGLADSTSSVATTFYVDAAVRAGTPSSVAGTVLALAGGAAVASRLTLGIVADRMMSGHLRLCATMLVCGAGGLLLLSTGNPAAMHAGAVVAFAGCWGFNGVFWYAMVRAHPHAPGRITGVVSPGGLAGSTLGPLVFGVVAVTSGYRVAWTGFAVLAVAAAALMATASRRLTYPPAGS